MFSGPLVEDVMKSDGGGQGKCVRLKEKEKVLHTVLGERSIPKEDFAVKLVTELTIVYKSCIVASYPSDKFLPSDAF